MNKFPETIQTEIRIADLLPIFEDEIIYGRFMFVCYAIGHTLNEKFKLIPESELDQEYFGVPYERIGMVYGQSSLSDQVNAQLFSFMARLGIPNRRKWECLGDFFLEHNSDTFTLASGEQFTLPHWSHDFRRELLKQILKMDPEAVFSINLQQKPKCQVVMH